MKHTARIITSWVYVLFLCIAVVAQNKQPDLSGNLRGSVADEAETAPIKYAFVLVHGKSGKGDITVKLDEHGGFDLRLAVGLYDVFVAADGFSPTCKKVEITAGHTTSFDVKLQPDSEHLQTNIAPLALRWGVPATAPLSASVVHGREYRYDAIPNKL
jgi:Carboxypeptidase regulatory-like domain